jgi:hypothetical protein
MHGTLIEIRLTQRGRDVFERADALVEALDSNLAGDLSPDELKALKEMLARITRGGAPGSGCRGRGVALRFAYFGRSSGRQDSPIIRNSLPRRSALTIAATLTDSVISPSVPRPGRQCVLRNHAPSPYAGTLCSVVFTGSDHTQGGASCRSIPGSRSQPVMCSRR